MWAENCPPKPLPGEGLLVFQNIAEPRIFAPQGAASPAQLFPRPNLLIAPCRRRPDSPVGHKIPIAVAGQRPSVSFSHRAQSFFSDQLGGGRLFVYPVNPDQLCASDGMRLE